MMASVDKGKLLELYDSIRPGLIRYPAIDEKALSGKVAQFLEASSGDAA